MKPKPGEETPSEPTSQEQKPKQNDKKPNRPKQTTQDKTEDKPIPKSYEQDTKPDLEQTTIAADELKEKLNLIPIEQKDKEKAKPEMTGKQFCDEKSLQIFFTYVLQF